MALHRPRPVISLALGVGFLVAAACQPPPPPPPDYAESQQPAIDAFLAAWNTGSVDAMDAAMSPGVRRDAPGEASDAANLAELKEVVLSMRAAYPDARVTLDDAYYLEDLSFGFWTFTGTNTGEGDMPPTGASVRISGLTVLRFADGRITEEIVYFDNADWLSQLGFTFEPPAAE
jgi:steroid delta-isomerase-like uncharacterized protein